MPPAGGRAPRTGRPLVRMIDLRLFRRAQFTWGTAAATLATFALFGMLFTLPQYLQSANSIDAFGTRLRL